jgi:hypothetical protein
VSDTSFGFLLLGSLAAVGAALAIGTLAALWRYHRTGTFPGHEPGIEVPRRRLVGLWARVGIGAAIAVYGVIVVQRSGVLG